MNTNQINKFDHDKFAQSKDETDFWGQVRRTVDGKPVDKLQVEQIIMQIRELLYLRMGDSLLDIGCGNGALSSILFKDISSYVGIDFSKTLINIAEKYFNNISKTQFIHSDVASFLKSTDMERSINKVMCQGSFSYLNSNDAYDVLYLLNKKFVNVTKVFLGSLPDKNLAALFYKNNLKDMDLLDHESPIGIWRTMAEFGELALSTGWEVTFHKMPVDHYTAYYRYDVLLDRK